MKKSSCSCCMILFGFEMVRKKLIHLLIMAHVNKEGHFIERVTVQEVVTMKQEWQYEREADLLDFT